MNRAWPRLLPLSRVGFPMLMASCLTAAGCSKRGTEPVPLGGTVVVNGKPAAGAVVTFHPEGAAADAPRPTARTGDDGRFQLTTTKAGDGAPAGEYRVTVAWYAPAAGRKGVEGEDGPPRPLVPAEYTKPDSTPLRASVQPGTADDITLTTTTGPNGAYSFTNLPAGAYQVNVTGGLPAGVSPTFAAAVVDFCHALVNAAEFLYVE